MSFARDHLTALPTNFVLGFKEDADYRRRVAEADALERQIKFSPQPKTVLVRALKPFRCTGMLVEAGRLADVIDDRALQVLINAGICARCES